MLFQSIIMNLESRTLQIYQIFIKCFKTLFNDFGEVINLTKFCSNFCECFFSIIDTIFLLYVIEVIHIKELPV